MPHNWCKTQYSMVNRMPVDRQLIIGRMAFFEPDKAKINQENKFFKKEINGF